MMGDELVPQYRFILSLADFPPIALFFLILWIPFLYYAERCVCVCVCVYIVCVCVRVVCVCVRGVCVLRVCSTCNKRLPHSIITRSSIPVYPVFIVRSGEEENTLMGGRVRVCVPLGLCDPNFSVVVLARRRLGEVGLVESKYRVVSPKVLPYWKSFCGT